MKRILVFITLLWGLTGVAQKATLYGVVTDREGTPLELVNVSIPGFPEGASTNLSGYYEFQLPANQSLQVVASFIGYAPQKFLVKLAPGERKKQDFQLTPEVQNLPDVVIEDTRIRHSTLERINPKDVKLIPSPSGAVESVVKTLPGVASNNELSSQYSVRGGNFDENLVYVNDIEIYRPFLVSSGQQEGLSFLNPALVSSISFSGGGFGAKYGDKMASVLDITYKRPLKFAASFDMSLLGGSGHLEGTSKNRKFSYLVGLRHKANQYLLKGLDTKGDYKPSFSDVQGLFSYRLTDAWNLSFLGNFARNRYLFIPKVRETDYGALMEAYRLTVYYDGQELDSYQGGMGAFTATYQPHEDLMLKFIASAYQAVEQETYDLQGQYWIGLLENDLGADDSEFDQVVQTIGVGTFLNHARNYLSTRVLSLQHRGTFLWGKHLISWGTNFQHEYFDDHLSEWALIDSAGYTLPRPPDSIGYVNPVVQPFTPLNMDEVVKGSHLVEVNRFTAFFQDNWTLSHAKNPEWVLSYGIRMNYRDLSGELLLSPRATLSYHPQRKKDIVFRFSSGWYYQPPFYREMRDRSGLLFPRMKAQRSIHFVAGADWNFRAWNRPFKFITELYYKKLNNLVPYKVDNVSIRYLADQVAHGYSAGVDFKVLGEFVRGVDSWMTLSILKTAEDIEGDFYLNKEGERVEPGYIARPTDQRVNLSIFFQDYIPRRPTWKMQLNLHFGTGIPYGPSKAQRYQDILRMPPYRRVDIGFSKLIKGENTLVKNSFFQPFKEIWVTAEVLNILQVSNTASYLWVKDIYGRQWPVPNYLTPLQVNVRLMVSF
ncbi:MAG: TonB-dependent receptor [Bacteroidetes bacterium]|nr:MAG: TonB-dependent receptor [Bacteroidota bacterium]PIE88013.1 MAG: TonB-dependent receptor [Bacteroidota bacterium]